MQTELEARAKHKDACRVAFLQVAFANLRAPSGRGDQTALCTLGQSRRPGGPQCTFAKAAERKAVGSTTSDGIKWYTAQEPSLIDGSRSQKGLHKVALRSAIRSKIALVLFMLCNWSKARGNRLFLGRCRHLLPPADGALFPPRSFSFANRCAYVVDMWRPLLQCNCVRAISWYVLCTASSSSCSFSLFKPNIQWGANSRVPD